MHRAHHHLNLVKIVKCVWDPMEPLTIRAIKIKNFVIIIWILSRKWEPAWVTVAPNHLILCETWCKWSVHLILTIPKDFVPVGKTFLATCLRRRTSRELALTLPTTVLCLRTLIRNTLALVKFNVFNQWSFFRTACCPEPCHGAASHFNVKGRCYDTARIGENCTHPAQCQGKSSCVPNTSGKYSMQNKLNVIIWQKNYL